VFQFAVLSSRMSTLGRTAAIDGLARKMSMSSPTGSKAVNPFGTMVQKVSSSIEVARVR
jgi:hypothetical protein